MKKYILITTALLLLLACRSRSVRHLTTAKLPEISKEKEVFDKWDLFKKRKGIKIVQNGNKSDTLYTRTGGNVWYYCEKYKEGGDVFIVGASKDSIAYIYDYYQNPFFAVYKNFYPNGNIKTKGVRCYFGFAVGEWYHFDENGNFMYSENKDEGYRYSYEKVFRVCKKYNIPLERKPNRSIDIEKIERKWRIRSMRYCTHIILLDGTTGKEISNELRDMEQFRCILPKKWKRKVKHIPYNESK